MAVSGAHAAAVEAATAEVIDDEAALEPIAVVVVAACIAFSLTIRVALHIKVCIYTNKKL